MKEHYKNQNNVVDSSGWLEYFSDAQNASFFAPAIETPSLLIVPSISIIEVFRHLLLRCAEKDAFQAIECMLQGRVVDLDVETAVNAAKLGVLHRIPMADSIILATGLAHDAVIWSQDA